MISTKNLGISMMKWIYTILIKKRVSNHTKVFDVDAWVCCVIHFEILRKFLQVYEWYVMSSTPRRLINKQLIRFRKDGFFSFSHVVLKIVVCNKVKFRMTLFEDFEVEMFNLCFSIRIYSIKMCYDQIGTKSIVLLLTLFYFI